MHDDTQRPEPFETASEVLSVPRPPAGFLSTDTASGV
jgi:hypothetical protein